MTSTPIAPLPPTGSSPRPAGPPRTSVAVAGTATVAVVASLIALLLGTEERYALIFPPRWITFVAAVLLLCSLLAARTAPGRGTGRGAVVLGWAAAVFFLGGSGGVVLDGFRAFFWATDIPAGDFDHVDWPGAVARALSLLAALTTVLHTWRLGAGQPGATAAGSPAGALWATAVLVVPYPLLKLVWWAQDLARPASEREHLFPAMELLAFGAASVLVLLLVSRRTPRALGPVLLAGGWFASMTLLSMGFLMVFGMLAQLTGVAAGVVPFSTGGAAVMVLCVYGTWLLLGLVVLTATLQLMDRRRRAE